jgi:hypothetical protein
VATGTGIGTQLHGTGQYELKLVLNVNTPESAEDARLDLPTSASGRQARRRETSPAATDHLVDDEVVRSADALHLGQMSRGFPTNATFTHDLARIG